MTRSRPRVSRAFLSEDRGVAIKRGPTRIPNQSMMQDFKSIVVQKQPEVNRKRTVSKATRQKMIAAQQHRRSKEKASKSKGQGKSKV